MAVSKDMSHLLANRNHLGCGGPQQRRLQAVENAEFVEDTSYASQMMLNCLVAKAEL